MYEIALSAVACLRAKTRADVAWLYGANSFEFKINQEATLFTAGGGKIGQTCKGAFDGQLSGFLPLSKGRKLELAISPYEASIAQLSPDLTANCFLVPATEFPSTLWELLLNREPFLMILNMSESVVESIEILDSDQISSADQLIQTEFARKTNLVVEEANRVLAFFWPIKKLAIAGSGEIADALVEVGSSLGWNAVCDPRPANFAGLVANLSENDAVVIMGHDVENSSQCLAYALDSEAGYIGALGSQKMQEQRADWLAYRNITDISRVHGPAGLDIGAKKPVEIAISILAEIIAVHHGKI